MPRMIKPLNSTQIDKTKPKEKEYTLADGGGLYLRILPTGAKLWVFNYYQPATKKRVKTSLGSFPEISLAMARAKREEYRALIAQGIDPQEQRKEQQEQAFIEQSNLFLSVAEKWKAKKALEIEELTLKKNWRRLETYVFPALGNIPVSEVLPNLVIQSLEPLQQQGKGDTLKRIIRMINEILTFAVNYGLIPFNPCLGVNTVFTFGKTENNPTIRPDELPELLYRLNNSRLTLFTRTLLKWQLLTMTRPNETSNAEWAEIDFDKKLWTIPANKMKTRKAHIIPLSSQAMALLEIMKGFTGNKRYIFDSPRKPNYPMNSQTANHALKALGYEGKLTAHGLRSIASTYLNEQLINYDVIEACLSHGIKDQVRQAYNRSDYLEQRKPVMQQWGNYVEKCESSLYKKD